MKVAEMVLEAQPVVGGENVRANPGVLSPQAPTGQKKDVVQEG
jgi:hypothetical protein